MIVSLYSHKATSGLVNHSQVNDWNLRKILEGGGALASDPYGVMKLAAYCCHHCTPRGLLDVFW